MQGSIQHGPRRQRVRSGLVRFRCYVSQGSGRAQVRDWSSSRGAKLLALVLSEGYSWRSFVSHGMTELYSVYYYNAHAAIELGNMACYYWQREFEMPKSHVYATVLRRILSMIFFPVV
ncbi:hypothetical protein ABW21_db0204324 [Orbilia brochopaga]|nr:hypothetical protein ABW21_db0204324 [Drechslerella brochopaga]